MKHYKYRAVLLVMYLLQAASGWSFCSEAINESIQTAQLLLFGGDDHKTFLGCLNCNRFDSSSVCNKYGDFGSRFSSKSIWNRFGNYGSRFSSYSPWNRFASDPPVIVDNEGNFYGYFSGNRVHAQRTTIRYFLFFLDDVDWVNEDLERARDTFCEP